jgi:hypothetical protein
MSITHLGDVLFIGGQAPYVERRGIFDIIRLVSGRSKKKQKRSIFEGIRKPTAPPSRKLSEDKPEERAHPAGRTSKHKHRDQEDADL